MAIIKIKAKMIHGIYQKSRPKNKWHLVSIAISAEAANHELNEIKKQAVLDGFDSAEVAIQIFESNFWIPEFMNEIKQHTPLYN